MLEIVTGDARRNCAGISRRDVLQVGRLALGGLTLPQLLAHRAKAAATGQTPKNTSVVMLFLTGGPSHIETFDPKLTAPSEYRSVTGEVATNIPGITFGGTFERLAPWMHRLALVRSFTHDISDHTIAVEQVARGGNTINRSGLGAVVSRLRGSSRPGSGMPTHVYLTSEEVDRQFDKERLRLLTGIGPADLGGAHAPFEIQGEGPLQRNLELKLPRLRLDDRIGLSRSLDRLNRQVDAREVMEGRDAFEQQALEMLLGKSRTAYDLSTEDPKLIAKYDTSRYQTGIWKDRPSTLGRQMLLARKLCEAGCGFITIHNAGWDMHGGDTQMNVPVGMERLGRPVDHAVSAFLEDVEQRGLSDQILLIITGEFGRSPKVGSNGGRDHWPRLSTLAFAGGGLRTGQVVGRSNSRAEEPLGDPVTLDHLFGTVMHVLFDVAALRQQPDLHRGIASQLDRCRPIADLF